MLKRSGIMSKVTENGIRNFFLEMENHQISAQEFFNPFMLESLERNFGLAKVIIMYFDTHGKFLSWTDKNGGVSDEENHPYREFLVEDTVRHKVYEDGVRDHLTYFDIEPRLYRASELIKDYDSSAYADFLESCFQAHYSLTMAFGINAYIQLVFLRDKSEGDFTVKDMEHFRDIYSYIATAYKNFKKYEQVKIISHIHGEIISSGEKAYLITDDFMHILDYSNDAVKSLKELLGDFIGNSIDSDTPCSWLPFLLGTSDEDKSEVHNRTIKNYIYTIHDYEKSYSNGIVDLYHWITIHRKDNEREDYIGASHKALWDGSDDSSDCEEVLQNLTRTEKKVAQLMAKGYTYKEIAASMIISYHTVKKHVENIYEKCHVNSRYQLMKLFNRQS